jgi:hypothetical protein
VKLEIFLSPRLTKSLHFNKDTNTNIIVIISTIITALFMLLYKLPSFVVFFLLFPFDYFSWHLDFD